MIYATDEYRKRIITKDKSRYSENLINSGFIHGKYFSAGTTGGGEVLFSTIGAKFTQAQFEVMQSLSTGLSGVKQILLAGTEDAAIRPTWFDFDEFIAANKIFVRDGQYVLNSTVQHGGAGSGNFGHAGRPGKVGGSAPSGEIWSDPYTESDARGNKKKTQLLDEYNKAVRQLRERGMLENVKRAIPVGSFGYKENPGDIDAVFVVDEITDEQDEWNWSHISELPHVNIFFVEEGGEIPYVEETKFRYNLNGGVGSGHFGHRGRPGKVGGSQSTIGPLLDYLKSMDNITKGKSIESVVLKHGQPYKAQALPKGYKRGKERECFKNAFKLAEKTGMTYVEGFATPDFLPLPVHHAWVVDKDGNVFDNTWKTPGSEYFGVPFELDELRTIQLEIETYGAFDPRSKSFREKYLDADK
jgi:hypothetical protein